MVHFTTAGREGARNYPLSSLKSNKASFLSVIKRSRSRSSEPVTNRTTATVVIGGEEIKRKVGMAIEVVVVVVVVESAKLLKLARPPQGWRVALGR